MRHLHHAILFGALVTITANAGSEHLVKQRAKGIRDEQNQRQGVPPASLAPPSTRPSTPAQPVTVPYAAQPAGAAVSQQATAINEHLGTIQKADEVTDEQTRQLAQSLTAAARGSVKPSSNKIDKLAGDLADALNGTTMSSSKRTWLAQRIESALKDQMSAKEMEALTKQIHDVLRDAGVGRVGAAVVSNDLKSIIVEVQRGESK